MHYINKDIQHLHRVFDQNSRAEFLRLDLNENPKGLPDSFITSVLSNVDPRLISEYPETEKFTRILADYLHVSPNEICLVNGSSEGIRYIIQTFTEYGGQIVGVSPSYAMFEIYAKMYGRNFIPVTYDENGIISIDNICQKITTDTQLVILVNPNNPMGNVYSETEFIKILERCKETKSTLLVDEAYHYFYPKTFIKYARDNDFVFITRTFSKLFSLAGLRLGYVVGRKSGIKLIQKMCTPHNVNSISMLFAEKLITDPQIVNKLITEYNNGKTVLIDHLKSNGYEYLDSEGNFMFIKPKKNPDLVVKALRDKHRILVKSYKDVKPFGECLRVTVADPASMNSFIKALKIEDGETIQ